MRLIAERITAERGGEIVFRDISFTLAEGEALIITGPNGAGKSTLLKVLAGLVPASDGKVGLENAGNWTDIQAASHYLGHHNAMKAALTVAENLGFWQDFLQHPRLGVSDALARVGLNAIEHLPYAYLSTGQRRRVAIARLLISHRPVWLLDEPTAGLDAVSEKRLAGIVEEHRSEGGIVIAATHQPLGLQNARTIALNGVHELARN